MIVVEMVCSGQRINHCKAGEGSIRHRDGYGAVQGHDGRGLHSFQSIVVPDDLSPIRICWMSSLAMHCGNRSLESEWARRAARQFLNQEQSLGDLFVIPAAAVLLLQNDELTGLI